MNVFFKNYNSHIKLAIAVCFQFSFTLVLFCFEYATPHLILSSHINVWAFFSLFDSISQVYLEWFRIVFAS